MDEYIINKINTCVNMINNNDNKEDIKNILSNICDDIKISGYDYDVFFLYACKHGRLDIVKDIIDKVNINYVGSEDKNGFMLACEGGHTDVVKYLYSQKKLDIHEYDGEMKTCFMYVCLSDNNVEIAESMIEKFKEDDILKNINKKTLHNNTALHYACMNRCVNIVKLLIKNKVELGTASNGITAISIACNNEDENIIKLLVENKCELNSNNSLDILLSKGNYKLAEYILSKKIKNIKYNNIYNKLDAIKLLTKYKNKLPSDVLLNIYIHSIENVDENKETYEYLFQQKLNKKLLEDIFRYCTENNCIDTLEKIYDYSIPQNVCINVFKKCNNIDVLKNMKDKYVEDIFVTKCKNIAGAAVDMYDCIKYILENRKHCISENTIGEMLLYICREQEEFTEYDYICDIVELFITHVDVDYEDYNGDTALLMVCKNKSNNSYKLVETLLKHGADINKKNTEGFTPLLLACEWDISSIIKLLIKNGANYDDSVQGRKAYHRLNENDLTEFIDALVEKIKSDK